MRMTVEVDDGLYAEIEALAHRDGLSTEDAMHRVLAAGLEAIRRPYRPTTAPLGKPLVRLPEKHVDVAAKLEGDEVKLKQRR